jgi:hypothetical protein
MVPTGSVALIASKAAGLMAKRIMREQLHDWPTRASGCGFAIQPVEPPQRRQA